MDKKVPMRQCISCRGMRTKKELLRIVKTPEGDVLYDDRGKVSGRGAYICRNAECYRLARKAKRFERAFSVKISEELYNAMEEEITAGE